MLSLFSSVSLTVLFVYAVVPTPSIAITTSRILVTQPLPLIVTPSSSFEIRIHVLYNAVDIFIEQPFICMYVFPLLHWRFPPTEVFTTSLSKRRVNPNPVWWGNMTTLAALESWPSCTICLEPPPSRQWPMEHYGPWTGKPSGGYYSSQPAARGRCTKHFWRVSPCWRL